MSAPRPLVCLFAISLLAACGSSSTPTPDGGSRPDAGGNPDSGPPLVCSAPLSACGAPPSCVDLTSSADDCGRCGHSCQGEACVASQCQPEQLASDQPAPERLAASDGFIYWSSSI